MLMHTRPSLACLLFPGFTRCTTADSPEAQADMEAGKPTTCHREPRLQLKQRNRRPQIHSQLLSQTQDFISRVIFSRSLLLVLPADIMWLLLQTTSLRGLVDFFFSEFCGTHVIWWWVRKPKCITRMQTSGHLFKAHVDMLCTMTEKHTHAPQSSLCSAEVFGASPACHAMTACFNSNPTCAQFQAH